MISWDQFVANSNLRMSIHNISGLAYITIPTRQLEDMGFTIIRPGICTSNGLFYNDALAAFGLTLVDGEIKPFNPDQPVNPECNNAEVPIIDPPPFGGFDCRCVAWYQDSLKEYQNNGEELKFVEPFVYKSGTISNMDIA